MLASVLRSSSRHQARAITTAAAKATPASAVSVATSGNGELPPASASAIAASHGELAWCEIYGMDYDQMVRDAQAESPIASNDQRSIANGNGNNTNTNVNNANMRAAMQQDIWSVVFGTARS